MRTLSIGSHKLVKCLLYECRITLTWHRTESLQQIQVDTPTIIGVVVRF
jgi:hypothetical protein